MKKYLNLILFLFFMLSSNSMAQNTINLFGLNASMDMASAETALNNNGYKCIPFSQFDTLCINEGKHIKDK